MLPRSWYTEEVLQAATRWSGRPGFPSAEARKNPQGIRVFKNTLLEYGLSKAHFIIPGLWALPASVFCFRHGMGVQTTSNLWIQFLVGIFSWTLVEYLFHLILFHRPIDDKELTDAKLTQFLLHGYHHEYPNDRSRLVMPVALAWPLCMLVSFPLWFILGNTLFWGIFSGILVGYVAYDWIHFYTHHARPKSGVGRYLRDFHLIHHFRDFNKNFGLSSPLWDFILKKNLAPNRPQKTGLKTRLEGSLETGVSQ